MKSVRKKLIRYIILQNNRKKLNQTECIYIKKQEPEKTPALDYVPFNYFPLPEACFLGSGRRIAVKTFLPFKSIFAATLICAGVRLFTYFS